LGAPLLCVAVAVLCSGSAIVLQAVAVRRLPSTTGLGASLVGGLLRSRVYQIALVLVAAGFALSFAALRTLPLFAVQAGRASSLGVAAVLSVIVLGSRLRWTDWLGLAAVATGLVLLAASVTTQTADTAGTHVAWFALVVTILLVVVAAVTSFAAPTPGRGYCLAVVAGTSFGVLALGARTAPGWSPAELVVEPVVWCAAVCGALGLASSALALRRAPVVAVTAIMVATETVAGAAFGVLLTGDRPADGAVVASVAAFVLVLGGAVVVARFGVPDADRLAEPVA
jgi:drug/metabolite transporter (DMT)-like permease